MYTDGACSGNPGPGGWAWAIDGGRSDSGSDADTTNQRMELTAVLKALDTVTGPVEIVSDSTYVVKCFNDRWYDGWLKRDWRNSNRKPVANRDLWEPVVAHFLERRDELQFTWVKGHSGDKMNDVVDAMAVAEVDRIRGAKGSTAVASVAEIVADVDVPWVSERAVVILGARELTSGQQDWLERTVGGLDPATDIVISGLRRGAELFGGELALARKIPLGVVVPFADPAQSWSPGMRQRFEAALRAASWVVDMDLERSDVVNALKTRNLYLTGSVAGAIVVNDTPLADRLDEDGLAVMSPPDDCG